MTQREFQSWQEYYAEAPFDDHHRYHRPAVLVSSSMNGGKEKDKFDYLVPPALPEGHSPDDAATLAAFGF